MATDRRRRRLKRLTLLFSAFVVLGLGVAGLWAFQQQRQQQRLTDLRADGFAALEAGDDENAARILSNYVDTNTEADAEALLAAAQTAYRLPQPGNTHIRRAQQWLLRLRDIDPKNAEGNSLLLEIAETRMPAEQGARIASDILRDLPDNGRARLLRASRRIALDEVSRAIEDLEYHVERNPGDPEAALLLVEAGLAAGDPPVVVAAEAMQRLDNAADPAAGPGLQLAAAYAQLNAGSPNEAIELLRAAASVPPIDGRYVVRLTRLLDSLNAFDESNQYIVEHAADVPVGDDSGLEVSRRLFEAGRLPQLVARLESLDRRDRPELHAIRAMALAELDNRDEAMEIIDLLADHADPSGKRWAAPLRAFYTVPRVPARVAEATDESIEAGLIHPYLLAIAGRSQSELDDHAAALASFRKAAEARPSWSAPRVLAAKTLLTLGRPVEAEQEADAAFVRRRDLVESLLVKAEAMAAAPNRAAEAVDLVQRLRTQLADEPRLILAEAAALAAAGQRTAARAAIESAINREPAMAPTDLLELARIGREANIDIEAEVLARLNESYGDRPELVFANAAKQAREGDVAGGLARIRSAMDPAVPAWRLVEAAYLQMAGDPGAAQAWAQTADAFPDRLDVQRRVLDSPAAVADRDLAKRVIDRVRQLSGEQNLQWRVALARWLLERPVESTEADSATRIADAEQAEALLDEVLQQTQEDTAAFLLRALAHERQGDLFGAVRDAEAALQRASDQPATRLEVARLQQAVGNFPAALSNLIAVAELSSDRVSPEQARVAAAMLAQQGEYQRATVLLEGLGENIGDNERLLLAQLLAQIGRNQDAADAIARLLAETPSADALAWAAGFYAESGRAQDAAATLARLPEAGVDPARQRAIIANHTARYGSMADALARFEAAAQAGDPGASRRLTIFNLLQGRGAAAIDAARQGIQSASGEDTAGLSALVTRETEVVRLANDPAYRPVLERMAEESDAAVLTTLSNTLRLAADTSVEANDKLARMRQLARDQEGIVELQTLAAQLHLRAGRNLEALELAEAAAIGEPNAVAPAQARALAFFMLGRYEDALAASVDWRRRSARDPLAADLLTGRIWLEKGQPAEAIRVLAPYRAFAERLPGQMADYAAAYGRALAEAGRDEEAVELIRPHLSLPNWRAAGMAVTTAISDPDTRSAWLESLTAAVPESNSQERFRLANAWWAFHLAGGTSARNAPDAGRLALRIVSSIGERSDATMAVFAAAGGMADAMQMRPEAVAAYQRALELEPGSAAVRNNLAMVLVGNLGVEPLDVEAGLQLAREAVSAEPDEPNYRDTLALAQAKAGDLEEALRTIEVAVELDPSNPAWQSRMGEIMRMR